MDKKSSRSAKHPMPLWAQDLAVEVRRRRRLLRLTQKELANLSGCGPDFLYDVEQGKPTLRLDKLVPVLTALGVQLRLEPGTSGVVTVVRGSVAAVLDGPNGAA